MDEQLSAVLHTSPLVWLGVVAAVGTWSVAVARWLLPGVVATIVVVGAVWLLAPGGQPTIAAARHQATVVDTAGCLATALVHVTPIARADGVESVAACQHLPRRGRRGRGTVERRAAVAAEAILDARRLRQ